MKKAFIIGSVVLVLGGLLTWVLVSRNKYEVPVWKTVKVDTGNVAVIVTATGTLNPVTTVQVGAQVSGIITKLFVDFDSVVKKGQVIALLDTTLLNAAKLNSSAAVEKARVQLELTRRQFTRIDTLFHQKVSSQNDYDIASENYKAARADLQAALATLKNQLTNLKYATIRAPFDGTVISRTVDVGQTVISSFNAPMLFTIAKDLKLMQVLANVDEADIGQVKDGQEATFTVDAYPYEVFKGKVAQIRLQPVMVQNVNNYTVVINVANPDLKLLPGLTATTTIKTQEHDNVLKVLVAAVHFSPPGDYLNHIHFSDTLYEQTQKLKVAGNEIPRPGSRCYIWLMNNNTLRPEVVNAGLFDGTYLEVAGNIKPGDEVVTGINLTKAANTTANNPFMPQMHSGAKK